MSDRSLDDFVPDDEESDADAAPETAEPAGDAGAGETTETAEQAAPDRIDPATIDPASPTASFTPDGAACAACGESVGRRWQQDGNLVCRNCKEW